MVHTLASKKSNTLLTRITPINLFLVWARGDSNATLEYVGDGSSNFILAAYWPPTEAVSYEYCRQNIKHGKAASRCQAFLSALYFCWDTFGLRVKDAATSHRMKGAALQELRRLGFRNQSRTLEAWLVEMWEWQVAKRALPEVDAVFIGDFMILLALRSRGADMLGLIGLVLEHPNFMAQVTETKTAKASSHRLPLEMRGPIKLTTDSEWLEEHILLREELGISLPEFPLFPARDLGKWVPKRATLHCINSVLRQCALRCNASNPSQIGTQSAKATLLSWAAKFGLSAQTRGALGSHKLSDISTSVLAYSRDRLREPLVQLNSMLESIRAGTFNPDSETEPRKQIAPAAPKDGDESDSSSSSTSSSSSSSAFSSGQEQGEDAVDVAFQAAELLANREP